MPVIAASDKNKTDGIPGTSPIMPITTATGYQACGMLICPPICSDIDPLDDTRVTIIAVPIDKSSEGICATKPSPIDKIV